MVTEDPTQEPHNATARRSRLVAIWGGSLALACSFATSGIIAYRSHARGADWLTALGFPLDGGFFRLVGDFIVPVMVTGFMLQAVRNLPPSREKTVLTWLGWSLFVFLFVWWSPLRITIFGTY